MKVRASIVVKRWEHEQRFPCLILDSSRDGFRLRGTFRLRRGQPVEVISDEDPLHAVRCSVGGSEQVQLRIVWISAERLPQSTVRIKSYRKSAQNIPF